MKQASSSPPTATASVAVDDDQSTAAELGEKLRVARERQSLSLERVAEVLHLDAAIIAALEQGDFETLGAPVYVQGHLRTYAQLLHLSPDTIVSEYRGNRPEPVVAPAPASRMPGVAPISVNPILWGAGALVVLLGLMLGVYVMSGNDEPVARAVAVAEAEAGAGAEGGADSRVADQPVAVVTAADAGVEIVSEAPPLVVQPVPSVVKTEPELKSPPRVVQTEIAEVEAVARPEVAPTPVPRPAATMRLGLQFNQESWVEISDASRRLLFGLQRKGRHREVTGEPPFSLLIGNARGVKLTINDEPFAVPAGGVRGKVARFEITGEEFE